MDRTWVRENWPFVVGAAIIVVGNVFLVVQGGDWRPGAPPFLLAIVVVLVLEIGRAVYRRFE